jgi:hypothetical protein
MPDLAVLAYGISASLEELSELATERASVVGADESPDFPGLPASG